MRKYKRLLDHETLQGKTIITEAGVERALTIEDIELSCFLPRGTIIEKEVNCDSRFMLANLPSIADEIRGRMPWVPGDQVIYLVMDNAGGHGTIQAIDEYTQQLQAEYNIEIIHQSARSPEVNALDLGIWMSVQSHVERMHRNRRRDPDSLAVTVQEAWDHLPAATITKIFARIPVVLQLIVDNHGENDLVETRRGMIHAPE
jgi:hypothetical protein